MPIDLATRLRALPPSGSASRRRAAADIDSVVAGTYQTTPAGTCFVARRRYAATHEQGVLPLASGRELSALARAALAPLIGGHALDPARALFLDTETTGLSGGTGTYAFLIGLGYFDGDDFVVEQYFMRHPGEEVALLHAVGEVLERFPLWVTFNGKGFDVPLLSTRWRMARRQPLDLPTAHLDLLGVARRLW